MGFDVKATADRVMAAVDAMPTPSTAQLTDGAQAAATQVGSAIAANPGSFLSYTLAAICIAASTLESQKITVPLMTLYYFDSAVLASARQVVAGL